MELEDLDISLEDDNLTGTLDQDIEHSDDFGMDNSAKGVEAIIENLSLTILAVLPTAMRAILFPKRLVPMMTSNKPISRNGMTLGPGIYFLAAMLLMVLALNAASSMSQGLTEEFVDRAGGGMSSAAARGSMTNFAISALPIYAAGILLTIANFVVFRLASRAWTLRHALASSFYSLGTFIIVIILPDVIIELLDPAGEWENVSIVTSTITLFAIPIIPFWHNYHFLRAIAGVSRVKTIGLNVLFVVIVQYPVSLF